MNPNQTRHKLLGDILEICTQMGVYYDTAIKATDLLAYNCKDKKEADKRLKALDFLQAVGHLRLVKYENIPSVVMTDKGLSAYDSEYFLEKDKEERAKKNHNTIASASALIVAFGVFWSILAPTSNKQDIRIQVQIPQQSKPVIDTTVSFRKGVDSANLIYMVDTSKALR